MKKKTLQESIARRKALLYRLVCILSAMIIVFVCALIFKFNTLKEISAMAISAFVSTILAIYMTKEDILENDYLQKKDDYGVLTFEEGYLNVFSNADSSVYLSSMNWGQFFAQAKEEKKLYFIGISFYYFFDDKERRKQLYQLCIENKYDIYIILANPYDTEIAKINHAEGKPDADDLKNKIINTYKMFEDDLKKEDFKKAKENLHIWFSHTTPTNLIIKSGKYMIITPYILDSPERTPTIIAEDSKSQSFYEKYEKYLQSLEEHHYEYGELRKNIPAKDFFNQSYTMLSQDFMDDMENGDYLAIIGLSQLRMVETLGSKYQDFLNRGGEIEIILTDPDGESTKMSARRSSANRDNIEQDRSKHKNTINRLLDMNVNVTGNGKISVYISDFMYPYTMYAFNCRNGVTNNTKMYIWQTVLFQPSEKRPGFKCEGREDLELMQSYYKQFIELRDNNTKRILVKYDSNSNGNGKNTKNLKINHVKRR